MTCICYTIKVTGWTWDIIICKTKAYHFNLCLGIVFKFIGWLVSSFQLTFENTLTGLKQVKKFSLLYLDKLSNMFIKSISDTKQSDTNNLWTSNFSTNVWPKKIAPICKKVKIFAKNVVKFKMCFLKVLAIFNLFSV